MLVKLLEPLRISEDRVYELAQPIIDRGHEFKYYSKQAKDVAELYERSKDADVVIIGNNPYPNEVIEKLEHLKLIDVAFTGVDHVGDQATQQGIKIANAAGYANTAVAELAVGLVLDLYRHLPQSNQDTRLSDDFPGLIQGKEIKGKKVGIIGTGKIGLETAQLFKAFGAELVGYNRSEKAAAKALGLEYMALDEVLQTADIISLHLPLTAETKGLIDADALDKMKESAVIINVARGAVIDNEALAKALNNQKIAGAGIDVYDMEPPIPSDYPLLTAKNTVLTPHIGYLTDEAMEHRAEIAFQNAIAFLDGTPQNIVN